MDITNKIIAVLVAIVVFVALFPLIVNQLASLSGNENISGTTSVFLGLIPLFIAIGVTMGVIYYMKGKGR